ncbi:MAG: polysaccharide biosynthesis/export family protein [Bacteroidales bacterium]|nr:polysaccharide biosynthesis/export family protein [Bacteroidales bacterium]
MKFKSFLLKSGLLIILTGLLLASCVPMRRIHYMQDMDKPQTEKSDFINPRTYDYTIHPGDNLYIKINSLDQKSNYFEDFGNYSNYYTESGIYLNSYTVSDSGYVEFPLIGKVMVINLTLDEIRKALQEKVNEYLKNTVVIVKLANFRISMLGEFKNPGKYVVYQDKITLFEAIAMAGDLSDFARKNRSLLIRQTEDGTKSYRINLNDRNILESDLYYLMPNDIVYVEPVRGKQFAFKEFPYVLIFTTITTTLLLIEYFK